jgi:four helix bundle protein
MTGMITESDLIKRTKTFGLRVIKMAAALPDDRVGHVVGNQILRSGTSVGANYRAACRGRSIDEFISKLGIVEEETDECIYWMEIIIESGLLPEPLVKPLLEEANELLAIMVASRKTARNRKSQIKNRKSSSAP